MIDRPKIYVVDDDAQGLRATARILSREFSVTSSTDARDLLSALRAGQSYAAIVSDVQMPEFSGRDLHEAIEREFPAYKSRIVFMTGGAPDDAMFFLKAQVPIFGRPVSSIILTRAVQLLARQ